MIWFAAHKRRIHMGTLTSEDDVGLQWPASLGMKQLVENTGRFQAQSGEGLAHLREEGLFFVQGDKRQFYYHCSSIRKHTGSASNNLILGSLHIDLYQGPSQRPIPLKDVVEAHYVHGFFCHCGRMWKRCLVHASHG